MLFEILFAIITVIFVAMGVYLIFLKEKTLPKSVSLKKLEKMEDELNKVAEKLNTTPVSLIKELDITKAALMNFFKILEQNQVPVENLDNTLREMAKRYKTLLATTEQLNPEDSQVSVLIEEARQALNEGQFTKAEMLFNEASELDIESLKQAQLEIQRMQEVKNKRFLSAAKSKAANGQLKESQLAYKVAAEYYEESANLVPQGEDKIHAEYLNSAGCNFQDAGLYDKAQVYYEQALSIRERVLDKDDPNIVISLNNLAELYRIQGKYAETEPLLQRALTISEKVFGQEHPNVAQSLNNLALLYVSQGKYSEAEPLFQQALGILKKVLGEEHPNVANSLNNLAILYADIGNYGQAKLLFERALAVWEKVYGETHPKIAIGFNNLARLHRIIGNYNQAESLVQRALAIDEKILGNEHHNVARELNNLADLHREQGKYDEAKPLYERSLAIYEKVLGNEHPEISKSINDLAMLYEAQGHYDKAKPLYERALAIAQKTLGQEHPHTQLFTNNYNNLLEKIAEKNNG